jgi:hypothetical protein
MPTDENFERQVIKLDKDENIVRMELCALNCLCFVGVETDKKNEHRVGIEKSNKKTFINLDQAGHGVFFRTGAWVDGMGIVYDGNF